MTTRTWVGGIALAALTILGLAMAAGGLDAAPAEGFDGAYGGGLGIDGDDYIQLERAALVAYAAVIVCAGALPRRLLWGATTLLLLAFAIAPLLLSLDVFSYLSYARLDELHGLNPYEAVPDDVPGDAALPYLVDNDSVVSAYSPVFTLITLPLAHLGLGTAVYLLKAVAALSVLGTAWLVARVASARGLDPRPAVALVALNPLVLVHVVGGGHNDALMAMVLTLGVAGVLAGWELTGGLGLIAAAGIKVSAAVALPFAAVEGFVRSKRLLIGLLIGAAGVIAISLLAYGSAVDAALDVAGANQGRGTSLSAPQAVADVFGLDQTTARESMRAAYLAVIIVLLAWVASGADWVRAAGWATLGLLVASNYVTPWYVILPLPLVAIARDRALVVASVLFTAFLMRHQVPGLGG